MTGGFFNFNFSPYLPPNAKAALLAYQYHGTDKSLIYKYMWKPLCAAAVEKTPVWLAPNVITVTALALVCMTHVLLAHYMPGLTLAVDPETNSVLQPPAWIFVLTGAMLFAYQFLDNLDGHQARRTKTSSPLGLLMDHGCDAFNCIVGSISVSTSVCAGATWKSWTVVITAVIVFFMNTWEEYYRGALVLPIINGPNEGILIAIAIYMATAVVGPQWWVQNSIVISKDVLPLFLQREELSSWYSQLLSMLYLPQEYHDRLIRTMYVAETGDVSVLYNTIAVGFVVVSAIITCGGNLIQVYRAVRDPQAPHGKYGSGWFLKHCPFLHALTRLLPLAVISVIANIWFFNSPTRVYERHPRLFCWTVGLLYTKLAIHLMIAHLCSVEFHPFRRTLVPFLYLAAHIGFSTFLNGGVLPMIDEEVMLYEFFALAVCTFFHLVINAVADTAHELGVPIFTVPKEKQRAVLAAAQEKQRVEESKKRV